MLEINLIVVYNKATVRLKPLALFLCKKGCDCVSHKLGRFILWWKITLCFLLSWVLDLCDCMLVRIIEVTVFAGRVKTTDLVNMIFNFCELYSGKTMFPYQAQFSKRVIRSILLNDGEEITSLFARQSGKSETIAITVGGLMIMLPQLANMPMFAGDTRLEMFKDGLWVGIFAPGKRQAEITYNRVRQRLQCKTALAVMQDPEFNLYFHTSNGQTCSLSNGSFVTCISASDQSNIEGESFKLIICEECQDISNYKIRKSIHPMGAAYNATIVKIGTATTFKGDFYDAIQRNKTNYEQKKKEYRKRGSNISTLVRNHFEYDYKVASKYNPKYAKYVEQEMKRLGENSDEFRMAYCVTPETHILTADLRHVRADQIKPGDKLIGFDEKVPSRYGQRKFKESVVEDVGVIQRPCYKLTLEDGTIVTSSSEHMWLVFTAGSRTQWKKTEELMLTDRIYKVSDVWDEPSVLDYKIGYLSAAFDGEGCVCQLKGKISQVSFSQRNNVMLKKVKQYLTDLGFTYGERVEHREGYDSVHHLYLTGGKYELYRFLGTVRPQRLLDSFDVSNLGTLRCVNYASRGFTHPRIIKKQYVGVQTVIPIRTSTRTFVANGLASHNCLEWIIERGMFVDIEKFEVANGEPMLERISYDKKAKHVAGIDVGGKNDDTVITIVEVDWSMPVIMEERTEDSGQRIMYEAYNTFIVDWCCIANEPDYEIQYNMIVHYLNNFWVVRVVCDATREASLAHRLRANLRCEVIPYIFTTVSKSELYKLLDTEISSGRARVPCGEATKETKEYKSFMKQLGDLQKGWSGAHMVCCHGSGKDDHDDYCDSFALAVWGASSKGEENNTETRENKFMKKTPNEKTANSRRNCLTARRMRRR